MSLLSSVLQRFVASVVLLAGAAVASAQVLVNDSMSRVSRTAAPTPDGAQWFSIGPGAVLSYQPQNLTLTHPTNGGAQLLGYLTPSASPVSL